MPCSADGSSARAISNVGQLVYGQNIPQQYSGAMFSARLKTSGLAPPSIAMVILNRSTQYNQKASKAFGAMFDEIKRRATDLLRSEQRARGVAPGGPFYDIHDTHIQQSARSGPAKRMPFGLLRSTGGENREK